MTRNTWLKPIEYSVSLPPRLDGSQGRNRLFSQSLIAAENDLEAIMTWLELYAHSPQTFRSYRKEIERLYRWCLTIANKPFSSLDAADLQQYWRFMANPQPRHTWCGPRKPRSDPHWKPFSGPINDASRELALTIIGRCYTFLIDAGYLRANPVRLMSRAGRPGGSRHRSPIERYLPLDTWRYLWAFINAPLGADATTAEVNKFERRRFLFALLYLQMPRVSEVARHSMNSFYRYRDQWWWRILGKGGKESKIPVSDEMAGALRRYRLHRGLPPFPDARSTEPLIASLSGERPISADMVYKIVKRTVSTAATALRTIDDDAAELLAKASTHWLRHTGLTHLADSGVDLRFLRSTARHESLETTQRYLHIEEDQWQQLLNKKRL